jgi:anhydro-N-acetylmuramic acid kinase
VVLNIGGIANLTLLAGDGATSGFDSGPGNVLMDAWCNRHLGDAYDADGGWAAGGRVVIPLLQAMLAEPYFVAPPPKSTGRDLFNPGWLDAKLATLPDPARLAPQDVQATLLELTARSIADQIVCRGTQAVYVCGGGAANGALMRRLGQLVSPAAVQTTGELGIPADWVEAVAFAWLASQHIEGVPANLAAVTGAAGQRILGALYPA